MGHAPSIFDEPLQPSIKRPDPPWYPRYLSDGEKYSGRAEWWADLKYKEPLTLKGKYRLTLPSFHEWDAHWWDPELPKGESFHGVFGLDTRYNQNMAKKADYPMPLMDYQKKIMESSVQYRQIAEKWNLSPEHPGINVSPTLEDHNHVKPGLLGRDTLFFTHFHHLGPRFWDKPIDEGCMGKGLALAKYGAIWAMPATWMQYRGGRVLTIDEIKRLWPVIRLYLSNLPFPCTLGMVYGVSLCTAAKIRRKDDMWNYVISSGFTGLTLSTIKGRAVHGVLCGLITLFAGVYYQYLRISPAGIRGRIAHPEIGGLHFGPLMYRIWEDRDEPPVPTEIY